MHFDSIFLCLAIPLYGTVAVSRASAVEVCQYISLFIKFVYKIYLCLKINQTGYELQGHCNFLAQCALVASQREIDMEDIIGHYELFSVCHIFIDSGES